ncbi:MAG: NAD(P)/FAD-dependent oxidoreductase [Candidatus Saccharimonadales bacterium]
MSKPQILIVGGGFGGVKAALELSKNPDYSVVLLSDKPDFWYFPSLYHVATGTTNKVSVIPLARIFKHKPVKVIVAAATKLDRKAKTIITADGQTLSYDTLVLALGVVTNYFGIPGLKEFSFGIKSIEDVEKLKTHLHRQLLDDNKPDLNYVIVGGGATGIELAGQLPGYLREIMARHGISSRKVHIDLVEVSKHLLPRLPRKVSRAVEKRLRRLGIRLYLGKSVQGETVDELTVAGKPMRSHTVIWTAGQAINPFFANNGFALDDHHKVAVNEFLEAEPSIYVIGDDADTPYSGMAQTAIYDAEYLAHNLRFQIEGRPRVSYRPKKPIYVTPAGPHWASVEWGRIHMYGWLGWFLREAGNLVGFHEIEPIAQAGEQWLNEFKRDDNCPICGDDL